MVQALMILFILVPPQSSQHPTYLDLFPHNLFVHQNQRCRHSIHHPPFQFHHFLDFSIVVTMELEILSLKTH